MKKSIILVIFLVCIITSVLASQAQNNIAQQERYYNSLYNCKPGKFELDSVEMFGHTLSFEFRVLGKRNNACYIRETMGNAIISCALPMTVARRYAQEGMRILRQGQQGVGYSQYIDQINNDSKYCKMN